MNRFLGPLLNPASNDAGGAQGGDALPGFGQLEYDLMPWGDGTSDPVGPKALPANYWIRGLAGTSIWNEGPPPVLAYSMSTGTLSDYNYFTTNTATLGGYSHSQANHQNLQSGTGNAGALRADIFTAEAMFENVANVTLNYLSGSFQTGSVDHRFMAFNNLTGLNGVATFPGTDPSPDFFEAFLLLANNSSSMTQNPELGAATNRLHVVLHEWLHTMGLGHPHDGGNGSQTFTVNGNTAVGDDELDNDRYTVMSYERGGLNVNNQTATYGYSATPMVLDIAALHHLYGSVTNHTTNTTYTLTDPNTVALDNDGDDGTVSIGRAFYGIWDTGGVDTITYGGTKAAVLNLNTATLSDSVIPADIAALIADLNASALFNTILPVATAGEMRDDMTDADYFAGGFFSRVINATTGAPDRGGYAIASDIYATGGQTTVIENATGGNLSDILVGNTAANTLTGNGGNDLMLGGAGDDSLFGGSGADEMFGGDGNDTLDFGFTNLDVGNGGAGNDTIVMGGTGTYTVVGGAGIDTVEIDNTAVVNSGNRHYDLDQGYSDDGVTYLGAWSGLENIVSFPSVKFTLIGNSSNNTMTASIFDDTLDGEAGSDTLFAGAGNDSLIGGSGADTLYGGDGDDIFDSGSNGDADYGGIGNDTFKFFFTSNKTVAGDAGIDTIDYSGATFDLPTYPLVFDLDQGESYNGGAYAGTWTGLENIISFPSVQIHLVGNSAANTMTAGIYNDTLDGGSGNDTLNAGAGNDIVIGGIGADSMDGGTGIDTLDYSASLAGVSGNFAGTGTTMSGGDGAGDVVTGFENVIGSDLGDSFIGDNNANTIYGGAGNDGMRGDGGADSLYGGNDTDYLQVGDLPSYLVAGELLDGGAGTDYLYLLGTGVATFDFRVATVTSIEWFVFQTNPGSGDGDKIAQFDASQFTGAGFEFVAVAARAAGNVFGVELFMETATTLDLSSLAFSVFGAPGDTISVFGDADAEVITGSSVADVISGAAGNDTLIGGAGNDSLDGGANNDRLDGGTGNDTLDAGAGNDIVIGGIGADSMDGGTGIDTLDYSASLAGVSGGFAGIGLTMSGGDGAGDVVTGFENVIGSALADAFYGSADANTIYGGLGADVMIGGGGADTLYGGGDADVLFPGNLSSDVIAGDLFDGEAGSDYLYVTGGGVVTHDFRVATLTSLEVLVFQTSSGYFDGNKIAQFDAAQFVGAGFGSIAVSTRAAGNSFDVLLYMGTATSIDLSGLTFSGFGAPGDDIAIYGDNDAEVITGSSIDDVIGASGGNDTLYGGAGNDLLDGGSGNDRLDGGVGNDVLAGGLGNDRYVVDSTADIIFGEVGFASGGGIDTVESAVSFTLPANIEILRLQGTTNINGTGNDAPEALVGQIGNNILTGRGGADVITAKAGHDTIIGGGAADTLVGDEGDDVFQYLSISDSYAGTTTRDFINGFVHGDDLIDLVAIDASPYSSGDQAFTWIGTAAFSGSGAGSAGQLRYQEYGGNYNIVSADWNGDGTANMQIFVNLTNTMSASDFIL